MQVEEGGVLFVVAVACFSISFTEAKRNTEPTGVIAVVLVFVFCGKLTLPI